MGIEVKNLSFVYSPGLPGETVALDDVSFSIEDGQICGIIGHTGSGKSTLLQQLNGLLKPSSGSVYVDGDCITDGSVSLVEVRKKVGLVFQYPEHQLFDETVARDVAFGPRNLGLKEDEIDKRVREAIKLVGLDYEEVSAKSPFELSGGQKRRIAIAGAIAMEPEVLILDEPTAGLDPTAHREIIDMIKNIHKERGIIVILVSHNMSDIAAFSDKVLVINEGKIAAAGTPREVFAQRDFLNSIGLSVPLVTEITKEIEDKVCGFTTNALTPDEAADEIAKLISSCDTKERGIELDD
ncbi:MAG: energy-coupling factor transporter ATPase [Clostridiales bacterium]|nr:energy-coupling factor transporter ATPase [Clostridiales bacterium]